MQRLEGRYGFLGYGNMGEAILGGVLNKGLLSADRVSVYDPLPVRMSAARERGLICAASPAALARACDTLFLAVKPQQLEDALRPILDKLPADILVISIMAGISIAVLRNYFGKDARILRVMPNTPALAGAGAAALACSDTCRPGDIEIGKAIFNAVGIAEVVPESCMDAVTALSGSGPAYFFYLTECMIKAAVAEGLPEPLAERLAGQTLVGAGQLLLQANKAPAVLREQVTSKGGTTFAALETLRAHAYEEIVQRAIHAAADRSRELGK